MGHYIEAGFRLTLQPDEDGAPLEDSADIETAIWEALDVRAPEGDSAGIETVTLYDSYEDGSHLMRVRLSCTDGVDAENIHFSWDEEALVGAPELVSLTPLDADGY